jgi:hypothetical protein
VARGTKGALAEVNPLDGMGRGHHAAVVLAVAEIEGVAEFVDGLFDESLAEEGVVGIKSVELLPEAEDRDDGTRARELGFAENIFQDWNVEIHIRHRQKTPIARAYEGLHALEEFRRMKLLPFGVVRGSGIEAIGQDFAGDRKVPGNGVPEVFEERAVYCADREQVNEVHGAQLMMRQHLDPAGMRLQP